MHQINIMQDAVSIYVPIEMQREAPKSKEAGKRRRPDPIAETEISIWG